MKSTEMKYGTAVYSIVEYLAAGSISTVAAIIERIRREREAINRRVEAKRLVEKQIRQQALGRLSLEETVRMGIDRY